MCRHEKGKNKEAKIIKKNAMFANISLKRNVVREQRKEHDQS